MMTYIHINTRMAYTKTPEEVKLIAEGGKLLGEVLEKISLMVKPGISAWEIDQEAERLIIEAGGRPAFKGYRTRRSDPKFPSTICASVNDEIVHGIATKKKILKDGDIFSMDIGMQWPINSNKGEKGNGYFTDTALTVAVGTIPKKTQKLLQVTQASLFAGIEQMQIGNSIADIGKAIENYIKPHGYGIVRDLVGHGVGYSVHEDPRVPNYYDEELEDIIIKEGMVLAIEPMVTLGTHKVEVAEDDWTILSQDGSLSGHFEHTIVATKEGPHILTKRPSEK